MVEYDHPDAAKLMAEVQQFYVERYGNVDATPMDPAQFAPPAGLFFVGYDDAVPIWHSATDRSPWGNAKTNCDLALGPRYSIWRTDSPANDDGHFVPPCY